MKTKKISTAAYFFINAKRGAFSAFGGTGRTSVRMLTEMTGNIRESDVGLAATRAADVAYKSDIFLSAGAGKRRNHAAFSYFRANIARAANGTITKGSVYTGVVSSFGGAENAVFNDIKNGKISKYGTIARKLFRSADRVDFSDRNALDRFSRKMLKNANNAINGEIKSDKKIELLDSGALPNAYTLAFLVAMNDKTLLGKATGDYTNVITNAYERAIENQKNTVWLIAKSQKFNVSDKMGQKDVAELLRAYQAGTLRLTSRQLNEVKNLQAMFSNRLLAVDKYLLGRIATGQVDVEAILKSGTLYDLNMTDDVRNCLKALEAVAKVNEINGEAHNQMLNAAGYESKAKATNLNEIATSRSAKEKGIFGVSDRIKEFERALDKAKIAAPNGMKFKDLTIKQLRDIVKHNAKLYTPAHFELIKELVRLREHKDLLAELKREKARFRYSVIRTVRSSIRGSDLGSGWQQTSQMIRGTKLAISFAIKTAKVNWRISKFLYRHSPKKVKKAMRLALKCLQIVTAAIKKAFHKASAFAAKYVTKASTAVTKAVGAVIKNVTTKAPRLTSTAKKASSKVSSFVSKKVNKFTAKRAQKKALKAAGKLKNGLLKRLSKALRSAMAAVLKVFLIVLAVALIITLIGGFLHTICSSVVSISDTLFGWFPDVDWPWEATPKDRRNAIYAVFYTLQEEEQKRNDSVEYEQRHAQKYYPYVDLNTQETTSEVEASDDQVKRLYYYYYEEEGADQIIKVPATPASNIKYAIGMAHTVSNTIEQKSDIKFFSAYAIGAWLYLNQASASMDLTVTDSGEYCYYCCPDEDGNPDKLYNMQIAAKPKTRDTASVPSDNNWVLIDGGKNSVAAQTENGCVTTYYYDDEKALTYSNDVLLSSEATTRFQRLQDLQAVSTYMSFPENITAHETHPLALAIPGIPKEQGLYISNPTVCPFCPLMITNEAGELDHEAIKAILSESQFHTHDELACCTNQTTVTCSGCILETKYHDTSNGVCECDGCETIATPVCGGHEITEFHQPHEVTNGFCDNVKILGFGLSAIKVCGGHESVKYCTDEEIELCSNLQTITSYKCPGYSVSTCGGHNVCLGHHMCLGHSHCPGHTVTYYTGDLTYTLSNTMKDVHGSDDTAIFNGNWSYEIEKGFLRVFSTEDTSLYTNAQIEEELGFERHRWLIQRVDENGVAREIEVDAENVLPTDIKLESRWGKFEKALALLIAKQDWYLEYKISCSEFEGGQCSPAERVDIKEKWSVSIPKDTMRSKVLDYAFSAIGQVPYYPNMPANSATFSANFGAVTDKTIIDEAGISRGNVGLGREYFADWVVWSCDGVEDQNTNTTTYHRNMFLKSLDLSKLTHIPLSSATAASGSIIVKKVGDRIVESGVYVGSITQAIPQQDGSMRYATAYLTIGIGTNWVELKTIDNPSGWFELKDLYP